MSLIFYIIASVSQLAARALPSIGLKLILLCVVLEYNIKL